MTQRFYFHDATTAVAGTLPGGTNIFGEVASVTAVGASTNRTMTGTIGAGQVSIAITTLASTSTQTNWFRRFVSEPIATQTIGDVASITVAYAYSMSSLNSLFRPAALLAVWRPGTGAIVGEVSLALSADVWTETSAGSTVEIASSFVVPTGAGQNNISALNGDILVVELWRNISVQSMGTAYTNTIFYDGTTEGSASNNAGYLDMGSDIAMFSGAAAANPPRTTVYPQILPH